MKTLIASALVVAAAATAANASNIYGSNTDLSGGQFSVETVVADGAGTLALYDYSKGERGELIGTTDLHAGFNDDVRINVNTQGLKHVQAELIVGGVVADVETFDVR